MGFQAAESPVATASDARAAQRAVVKFHEYEFGLVRIEFMGELTAGRVIFGPDDAEPLLGVTALASAGFTVDPASQTVKRLPAIPLKAAARRPRVSAAHRLNQGPVYPPVATAG